MGRRKDLDLEERLGEAVQNIRQDRSIIGSLLTDLMIYMKKDPAAHKECGLVASKYVETLQRSNEQLVKVANILHKKENSREGFTDRDKSELYDIINNDGQEQE